MARILLVDDEPDIRDMLRDALELAGHDVDTAATATDALREAAKKNYHVAIVDYVLPGKRGLDLVQELKSQHPFIRSIIISGQIDHDILNTVDLENELKERVSVDRYIAKPADVKAILGAITQLLEPSANSDWKSMAADAVAAKTVKKKDVRELDRTLQSSKRKPR
jgi:DNA-binding response OmpR family regulator